MIKEMKVFIKKLLYIIGVLVVIVSIFFSNELPEILSNLLWILASILLLLIIIFEIITKGRMK
jgi:protein-S-isoprenylcysteine O-methyltransferase Ste14